MNEEYQEDTEYTSSDAILVEFTDTVFPPTDKLRRKPRGGRPSGEELERRAMEADQYIIDQYRLQNLPDADTPKDDQASEDQNL